MPMPSHDRTASDSTRRENSSTNVIDHEMHEVRQHVTAQDAPVTGAEGARGGDVVELAQLERLAADDAREPDPAGDAEGDADLQRAAPERHDQGDEQQQGGDRGERGDDEEDHVVDAAAEVAGAHAERAGRAE